MNMAKAVTDMNPQNEMKKTDRLKLHNKAQLVSDMAVNLANGLLLHDPSLTDVNNNFDLLSELKAELERIDQHYRYALNARLHKNVSSSGI